MERYEAKRAVIIGCTSDTWLASAKMAHRRNKFGYARYAARILTPIALLSFALSQNAQAQSSNNTNKHRPENEMTNPFLTPAEQAEQNKQVVVRFNNEFFAKGNTEIAKELLAETFVNHSAPPNAPADASVLVKFITGFHKAFSDISVHIDVILGEDDKVSLKKTITATHTGEFMGKKATGKKLVMNGMDIEILKNGKITEHWSSSDFMQVFQGL